MTDLPALSLTPEAIVALMDRLPAFPRVVTDLLASLDDEGASMGTLAHLVASDPVVTARVMSLANSAACNRRGGNVSDVATATSMIGLSRLREIVLAVSVAEFARKSRTAAYFWEHSVVVGVGAQELAKHTQLPLDYALVAGLLHDIGQLWMASFHPEHFARVRHDAGCETLGITEIEARVFGIDHCQIGAVMAEHWGLPTNVVTAIRCHHQPDDFVDDPLVAVTHVAEVLSNALDLTERDDHQVTYLSQAACDAVGICWDDDLNYLFGKIEARSEHACRVFRLGESAA